jgi:hypothetical protein
MGMLTPSTPFWRIPVLKDRHQAAFADKKGTIT